MIVGDAITLLQNGRLASLKLKEVPDTVLGYINMGILELHKRFNLWQDKAEITMANGVSTYALDGVDANVSIDLSNKEFLATIFAYNNSGKEISINDSEDTLGITTPRYNTVEVATITVGEKVFITYRAAPSFLLHQKAVIPLPAQMLEALFNYVAWEAFSTLQKPQSDTTVADPKYRRFEASCNRIKAEGLYPQKDMTTHKFYDRGFV